ncbi:uncharacterized protein LOC132188439 [Corylus avellana]|uniref:uncharacterized protein LOC132188439 n=1 Tax=Corylus avellana TaxID=13451 RepID=UPI001E23AFE4|nr:uncharacterized protein LOC132188439 [Corylus avellana]
MSSSRLRESKGKESSLDLDKDLMKSSSAFGSSSVDCTQTSWVCYCSLPAPLKTSWTPKNPERRFWGCTTYDSNRKAACRFFKWMDESICEKGMKVIPTLLDRVKELENENCQYLTMVKDLETECDSYIARVNQLEKGDDKQLEMLTYLEKEKDVYRAREKFLMFGLLLSWLMIIMLIGISALSK